MTLVHLYFVTVHFNIYIFFHLRLWILGMFGLGSFSWQLWLDTIRIIYNITELRPNGFFRSYCATNLFFFIGLESCENCDFFYFKCPLEWSHHITRHFRICSIVWLTVEYDKYAKCCKNIVVNMSCDWILLSFWTTNFKHDTLNYNIISYNKYPPQHFSF